MGLRGNFIFKLFDRYLGIPLVWVLGIFNNKKKQMPEKINSILVIKLSAMGDTVLLMPVLRSLRSCCPDAKITMIGTKINQDILRACPYINELNIINVKKILINPFSLFKLFKNKKFDIAMDFDQWTRISPLLAFLSGASVRFGFKTEKQFRHYLYTDYAEHSKDKHELECFYDILKLAGITGSDKKLEFWIDDSSKHHAEILLTESGLKAGEKYIVFHPETPAHGGQRQWPAEKYIELGKSIKKLNKYRIVVAGTESEKAQNSKIVEALGPEALLMPSLSLGEYAAVLSQARMLICGNTGIMHLAAALDVPVIALHGPTDPVKWGPIGSKNIIIKSKLKCSPCLYLGFEYKCGKNRCMQDITADEVFEAVYKVANSISN